MNKEFWIDTAIRCAWTFAETMLSCMTIGQAIMDINWLHALSISAVAAVYTLFKQIVKYAKKYVKAHSEEGELDGEDEYTDY